MLSERPKVFTTYAAYFRVSPFQRGNPSSLMQFASQYFTLRRQFAARAVLYIKSVAPGPAGYRGQDCPQSPNDSSDWHRGVGTHSARPSHREISARLSSPSDTCHGSNGFWRYDMARRKKERSEAVAFLPGSATQLASHSGIQSA